jgi:Rod binding domain-containing protein
VQLAGVGPQELSSQSTSEATHQKNPKLERCAREFEASLMAELLKPLQAGDGLTGEDSDSGSGAGSGGALSGFASESLARAISERGGFGIADRILNQLEPSSAGGTAKVQKEGSRTELKLFGSRPI